jgi:hypothetical protein
VSPTAAPGAPRRPRPPGAPNATGAPDALRAGVLFEQVLGHVAWGKVLRAALERQDAVEATWAYTKLLPDSGALRRLPVPGLLKAGLQSRADARRGFGRAPLDVLVFNTAKTATLCQPEMRRTPSALMFDATPAQLEGMAAAYGLRTGVPRVARRAQRAFERATYRLARLLLPCCDWVRRSLVDDYGMPADRIEVLPVGIDLGHWAPSPAPRPGKARILFVGGDFARKGGPALLRVFRELELARVADLHLVTGVDVPFQDGVHVHAGLTPGSARLLELFRTADLFVLPTLADCFPNVAIEAAACGVPVVISDVGGCADLVTAESGVLVPPGDDASLARTLRALVDAPERRRAMGAAGRAHAEARFDADRNARRLVALLRRIRDEGAAARR